MPARIDEIMSIGNTYNIPVIEDAAEALGSKYNERQVGNFGLMSILSFNGNKIITTSGGGAIVTRSKDHKDKAKRIRFLQYRGFSSEEIMTAINAD